MIRSLLPLLILSLSLPSGLSASPYTLPYAGRLATNSGRPVTGPVSLTINFYNSSSSTTALAAQTFVNVPLKDGLFSLNIELSPTAFETVFAASEVWIEVVDGGNGRIYPRQRFGAVPYAFKVPTDGLTLGYDANGKMRVQGLGPAALPSGNPSDGQILKWKDGTGWEWGADNSGGTGTGSVDSTSILDGTISNSDIAGNAAIAGSKIAPNFGAQNIVTTGTISGDGSGLTNLPAGPLGSNIDGSEIANGSITDTHIAAGAAIDPSKINGLTTALAAREGTITAGTGAQYFKGDKTWATLDTAAVPENVNLYYTDARARAALSAAAPLSYNSSTGAFSITSASGVSAGTISAAEFLAFSAKQAAITAASTVNTGTLTTALQSGVEINPYGSNAGESGELRFKELAASGSNYIGFKAPDTIAADKVYVLPAADGSVGQFLSTDGAGNLSWDSVGGAAGGTVTSITAGTGLSGGTITGSGTINLANTAVSAGSYTRANITVDAQGRLTAAASGSSVNLASEVTGTLPLANGGTGATTAGDARTALGLGGLATMSAISSSEITNATITNDDVSGSAAIAQSKIDGLTGDLSALSSGVAGKEAAITAGTTAQYWRGDKSWQTLDSSIVPENTNLYFTDARARAAVSGVAPLSYNSTSGAFSLPSATSVANGYLSSGDWLTFNNKQAAISAASTVNTGTLTTALQNGLELKPFGTNAGETGEVRFDELSANGSEYVGFKAPNAIGTTRIWTLPGADGTNGQVLSTNGTGTLAWTSPGGGGTVTSITAGTGLSGGSITGSGTIDLADTAVSAGSYTRANITVDAQGRLTAAANGSSVNLTSEVTGALPLANGGTGATTAGDARTALGLGSLATQSSVNLATETTGTLALASGGTGATSAAAARTSLGLGDLATLNAVGSTEITDATIANADIAAAAGIVDTKLDTISTAGKVSNSATTATSANTASAIVARDPSGDFTAGTITATLNGNASTATTAGSVSGTVAIVNGGTGATTAALARTALGLGSLATHSAVGSTEITDASIANTDISASAAIDASKIADGSVSTAEFQYINSLTSNAQTQLDAKASAANPSFTGVISAPLGAVGAPSYTLSGDPNTGIWSSAADHLDFSTAGANRLTIDASGEVGIGTSNPSARLHLGGETAQYPVAMIISPSAHATSRRASLALDDWEILQDSSGSGAKDFSIWQSAASSNRFYIGTSGNVGIGTTEPATSLQVVGGIRAQKGLSTTDGNNTGYSFESDGDTGMFAAGGNAVASSDLAFKTDNVEALRIKNVSGYIGIGTTTPYSQVNTSTTNNVYTDTSEAANYQMLISNPSGSTGTGLGIAFSNAATPSSNIGAAIVYKRTNSNARGELQFYTKQNTTSGGAPTQTMVISDSGQVGIGTTAPSAKLDVNGSLKVGGGSVTSKISHGTYSTSHPCTGWVIFSFSVGADWGVAGAKVFVSVHEQATPSGLGNALYQPGDVNIDSAGSVVTRVYCSWGSALGLNIDYMLIR